MEISLGQKCCYPYGADIEARSNDSPTAMMLASKNGCNDCAKLLPSHDADIDARDNDRRIALLLSVFTVVESNRTREMHTQCPFRAFCCDINVRT